MTILVVDSGNHSIKWAMLTHDELIEHGRVVRAAGQYLASAWSKIRRPTRVVVGNVAGQHGEQTIAAIAQKLWQLPAEFVHSSRSCCGVTNCYADPAKLGIDRLLAMGAAKRIAEGPVVVIDCGTAVTIDLVDENGVFRGGVIMAGLGLSRAALQTGTTALNVYDEQQVSALASSTADAVTSGTLMGLVGAIERVVREQSEIMDADPAVLLSGGDAERLLTLLDISVEMHPDLVLQGLRIYCKEGKRN